MASNSLLLQCHKILQILLRSGSRSSDYGSFCSSAPALSCACPKTQSKTPRGWDLPVGTGADGFGNLARARALHPHLVNRCVIKSVPLSEKCWIKGIQKKDLKFLPKTVLNLQDNISSLHLYYLKITRNDIRIFQYPELVFFLLIPLEKEGIVQISYSSHLISKPAWFCLKKEGLSYALPTPHHV